MKKEQLIEAACLFPSWKTVIIKGNVFINFIKIFSRRFLQFSSDQKLFQELPVCEPRMLAVEKYRFFAQAVSFQLSELFRLLKNLKT